MSAGGAPAGDRAWWPVRQAILIRPSGRSFVATASRGHRRRLGSPLGAMSGPAPATFFTWIHPATRALSAPVTRSPAIAHSARASGWIPRDALGNDFCHAIVDDHSRLAYVELHPDERAATVTGFVERALEFFASHQITTKRLMTDNAFSYAKNRSLRELLGSREIKHLFTAPYRPQTNGKVERFHQTMGREWAYGMAYRSHRHRSQALPHWIAYYNKARPHSSLGGRAPISRVHNVHGQDS